MSPAHACPGCASLPARRQHSGTLLAHRRRLRGRASERASERASGRAWLTARRERPQGAPGPARAQACQPPAEPESVHCGRHDYSTAERAMGAAPEPKWRLGQRLGLALPEIPATTIFVFFCHQPESVVATLGLRRQRRWVEKFRQSRSCRKIRGNLRLKGP
ncbi:hypothetical protein NN561_017499 [Cricetulus griseus]